LANKNRKPQERKGEEGRGWVKGAEGGATCLPMSLAHGPKREADPGAAAKIELESQSHGAEPQPLV